MARKSTKTPASTIGAQLQGHTGAREYHFNVYTAQRQVLETSMSVRYMVLSCGRRWGKDHLAAIKIISHSLGNTSPKGVKKYAYINPVYNPQSRDSFQVFLDFAHGAGLVESVIQTPPMRVTLTNGDIIVFFSADQPDNLRGGQYDGIIINEAGLMADLKAMWDGPLRAMLLDRLGWCWIQGTPKGKNAFHTFWMKGFAREPDWASYQFKTEDNPFMDKMELEKIKRDTPEAMWRQEYCGEFIDGAGTVFRGLDAMRRRSLGFNLLPQADGCRVGIDIARHVDFSGLIALSPRNAVVGYDRFNNLDWNVTERRIKSFMSRYRGRAMMDVSGAGDPVYTKLNQMGVPIQPVTFTNAKKAAMVQNLAMLIEQGDMVIPIAGLTTDPARDTVQLWRELSVYTYEITAYGRMRYTAPAGEHDDMVTALFLAASELPPMDYGEAQHNPWAGVDLNDVIEVGESIYR